MGLLEMFCTSISRSSGKCSDCRFRTAVTFTTRSGYAPVAILQVRSWPKLGPTQASTKQNDAAIPSKFTQGRLSKGRVLVSIGHLRFVDGLDDTTVAVSSHAPGRS